MPKHTCSLESAFLCLLKPPCHFRQNLIHMFLIHILKHITMVCSTHLKFMTFGVAPDYLSIKQLVTLPIRARTWPSEKRGCAPKPKALVVSKPGWCLEASARWHFVHCLELDFASSLFPPVLCSKHNIVFPSHFSLPKLFLTALKLIAYIREMLF